MTKLLCLILTCLACATTAPAENKFAEPTKLETTVSTVPTNAPVAAPAADPISNSNDTKHKLQAGDTVTFRIAEDREPAEAPAKILKVSDTDELDIPYLGLITVKDKTCRQVVAEITPLLEKDYYVKATVTLGLQSSSTSAGHVYIYGEVKNQAPIALYPNETFTVSKAIVFAGGFADFAKKSKVRVTRKGEDGKTIEKLVNMEKFFEDGKLEEDFEVRADDTIFVPKRIFNP
jgi:polysaccharide export outer membrane protein